jgi:hypothetical protein
MLLYKTTSFNSCRCPSLSHKCNQSLVFHVLMSIFVLMLQVFNVFKWEILKYIMETCGMMWNEYNEDKVIFKSIAKHYK